ncbi:MAG: DUF86 domain-containing protein [Phycisphaerae bacterium]|jgi:uncharacterized protein with HEPN domain|nr:DUF86 domain-containing protein [Phycisphaerae bacterium]
MPVDDLSRLRHMLESATEAASYIEGRTRGDLDRDRMLVHSLVRCVEILGEAASRVSADRRGELPDIPWTDIVSMRNRLIHGYFDIDLNRVWDTIIDDLPPLIISLRKALEA